MCLATRYDVKVSTGTGYKVLRGDPPATGLCSTVGYEFPLKKWVVDENPTAIKGVKNVGYYPAGFHICLSKGDACIIADQEGGKVYKVKFRKAVAIGGVHWIFFKHWDTDSPELECLTVVAKECKRISGALG